MQPINDKQLRKQVDKTMKLAIFQLQPTDTTEHPTIAAIRKKVAKFQPKEPYQTNLIWHILTEIQLTGMPTKEEMNEWTKSHLR